MSAYSGFEILVFIASTVLAVLLFGCLVVWLLIDKMSLIFGYLLLQSQLLGRAVSPSTVQKAREVAIADTFGFDCGHGAWLVYKLFVDWLFNGIGFYLNLLCWLHVP